MNMLKKEKKKASDAVQQLNTIGLGTPGSHQMALQCPGRSQSHPVEKHNGRNSLSAGDRVNGAGGDMESVRVQATKAKICKFIL